MLTAARRSVLCGQTLPATWTGIDFVRVADTTTQEELHVFFIVDPSQTRIAEGSADMLGMPGDDFVDLELLAIEGADEGYQSLAVTINTADWITDIASGRTVLRLFVEDPGDFSDYRLTIDHDALDLFFRSVDFSFKQACPSDFDCREKTDCPPEESVEIAVDYMARDFDSFRHAVIDFTARRYPHWQEKIPADGGMMVAELLCALADEFSYMQDRIAREAHFATATQRRSLHHMARLVDYDIDRGESATVWLTLEIAEAGALNIAPRARAGDRLVFWALAEDTQSVPYEVVVPAEPHDDYGDDHFWLHPQWNDMQAYVPDPDRPCLPAGSTDLYIAPMENGMSPLDGTLDAASARAEIENWIGRRLIFEMDPDDPSRPHRRWAVTVTAVELVEDPLAAPVAGDPFWLTRISWEPDEATPFELSLPDVTVHANNLRAVGGRTIEKLVRTGDNVPAAALGLEEAIIRQGARYENAVAETVSARRFNRRVGLEETVAGGLAFSATGMPFVRVEQIDGTGPGADVLASWDYTESLIEADDEAEVFTLEPGLWTEIRRFERLGEVVRHADYASSDGFTVMFGDGVLGAGPAEDAILRITYRLNPGAIGNVPSRVITALAEPGTDDAALDGNYPEILSVTNLSPAAGGRDPETPDHIRRHAPVVYRQRPLRAVTEEDYRSILSRLSFVQTVGARQRWTGSWLTRFLTADPLDANELSAERKEVLLSAGHSIRQVGRHIEAVDPVYRPVDLEITICVKPDAYYGQVKEAVIEALTRDGDRAAEDGLFHPDNFSFGTPLSRSSIEAAVQRVPGVLGVERICIKPHQDEVWREFTEDALRVGAREIIQLRNDARYPDQGTIRIRDHQQVLEEAGCGE